MLIIERVASGHCILHRGHECSSPATFKNRPSTFLGMPDAGRLTRDEAFLLVGLLVADADGRRLPIEVETLLDRLQKRNAQVEERSRRLVQSMAASVRERGLAALLGEITRALPRPEDRRWAFGLAVEVAYADRVLHPSEVEHIADLGDAIGLDENDVLTLTGR